MRTWRDRLIAVVDTETTGLDAATDCVVEIGVAIARLETSGATVVQARSWLVRPRIGVTIPESATKVHGLTDADVADAPPFAVVMHALVEMVGPDAVLAGFNARFDRAMLIAGCLSTGCPVPYWLASVQIDGGDPMPDDLDELVTWQRILAAERESNFLRWLVRQPPRAPSPTP